METATYQNIAQPIATCQNLPTDCCKVCNQPVDVREWPANYIRLRNGRPVHLTCAGRTRDLQD